MKNIISIVVVLFCIVGAGTAWAFTPPVPTGFVTDTAGKMTPDQVKRLDTKVHDYDQKTKNEIAVLIIPTLNGEDISDVAYSVFNTYKVGKVGLDNGILILIASNDRKIRIETGKGIEGEITDLQSKDIINSMKPDLKAGNYYEGIDKAIDQIEARLDSRAAQASAPPAGQAFNQSIQTNKSADDAGSAMLIVMGIVFLICGGFTLFFIIEKGKRRRAMKAEMDEFNFNHFLNEQRATVAASAALSKEKLSKIEIPTAPYRTSSPPVKQPALVDIHPSPSHFEVAQAHVRREAENREREEADRRRRRDREDEDKRRRDDDSSSSGGSFGGFGGGDDGGFGGGSSGGGGSSDIF